MKDLFNHVHLVRAISPVSVADNTAQVSQIVDRRGFDSAMFANLTGSLADADVTFAVLLEESDEAGFSPSNAVADADLLGTEALAGSSSTTTKRPASWATSATSATCG